MSHPGSPLRRASLALALTAATACGPEAAPTELEATAAISPVREAFTGLDLPAGVYSLTFDDGLGRASDDIARYLRDQGIKATFFVNGCMLDGAPPLDRDASAGCVERDTTPRYRQSDLAAHVRAGHRLGNHTQDHVGLPNNLDLVLPQLRKMQATLDPLIDDGVWVMRPPGNAWSAAAAALVDGDADLSRLIGPIFHNGQHDDWSCLRECTVPGPDGCDRFTYTGPECADRLVDDMDRGGLDRGIIQLHDRHYESESSPDPADHGRTRDFAVRLVSRLRARGARFVPLDAVPGVLGPRRLSRPRRWSTDFGTLGPWEAEASRWLSVQLAHPAGRASAEVCGRAADGVWCARAGSRAFATPTRWTTGFSDAAGFARVEHGGSLMFGDLDRDGDDDVCARKADGVYCAPSSRRSFRGATRWSAPGDFTDAGGWSSGEARWGAIALGDVNGDGRADLCGRGPDGVVCALNRGLGFAPATLWLSTDFSDRHGYAIAHYGSTMMLGDVSGDGAADVCFRAAWGLRCAESDGVDGFRGSREWTHGPFSDFDGWTRPERWRSIGLVDADGDGDADVCGRTDTGVLCGFSDRRSFARVQYLDNQQLRDADGFAGESSGGSLRFGDLNGDGAVDACGRNLLGLVCSLGSPALLE